MNKMKLQKIVSSEVLLNSDEKYIVRVKGAGVLNDPPQSISDCTLTISIFKKENRLIVDAVSYQDIFGTNVYEFEKNTVYNKSTEQFIKYREAFISCYDAMTDILDAIVRRCIEDKILDIDFYFDKRAMFGFITPME